MKSSIDFRLLRWVSGICSIAGLMWGTLYVLLGLKLVIWLPYAFAAVVGLAWLVDYLFHTARLLYFLQLLMIWFIPSAIHFSLGGFNNSGAVILWSLLAPAGALTFKKSSRDWIFWLGLFSVTVTAGGILEGRLSALEVAAADALPVFWLMNMLTVPVVLIAVIAFFKSRMGTEADRLEKYRTDIKTYLDSFLTRVEELGEGRLMRSQAETGGIPSLERLDTGYNAAVTLLRTTLRRIQADAGEARQLIEQNRTTLMPVKELLGSFETAMNRLQQQIEQSRQSLDEVKQNEHELNAEIARSSNLAEDGSKAISHSLEKNREVFSVFESARDEMNRLEESMGQISEIMNSINHINDRTQMLALNASIEAARAGSEGRGFAVVAHEISNLTGMTSDSTSRIESVTASIQRQVTRSIEIFTHGIELAAQTRQLGENSLSMTGSIQQSVQRNSVNSRRNHELTDHFFEDFKALQVMLQATSDDIMQFLNSVESLNSSNSKMSEAAAHIISGINQFTLD